MSMDTLILLFRLGVGWGGVGWGWVVGVVEDKAISASNQVEVGVETKLGNIPLTCLNYSVQVSNEGCEC